MTRRHRYATILLAAVLAMAPALAHAGDLDAAKQEGHVGERFDGYLGLVDENAPTEVKALVEDINRQRRQEYEKVAEKNKVPVDKVGQVAGQKLIQRTKSGQFVLPKPTESWEQKPD